MWEKRMKYASNQEYNKYVYARIHALCHWYICDSQCEKGRWTMKTGDNVSLYVKFLTHILNVKVYTESRVVCRFSIATQVPTAWTSGGHQMLVWPPNYRSTGPHT